MGGECFVCMGAASERYTLILEDSTVIEDKRVCNECLVSFQETDWIQVQDTPVLKRGGDTCHGEDS